MQPRDIVEMEKEAFQDVVVGLGGQLVELLQATQEFHPDLVWYIADVDTNGPWPGRRQDPQPILIGDAGALIQVARLVDQFLSGVFVGLPAGNAQPKFREGGLWTEDEEKADLGDAVVELRAFDTSFWSIATAQANLAKSICKRVLQKRDGSRH